MGDPSEELQRTEALAKQRRERAEGAELRAEERGHVSSVFRAGRITFTLRPLLPSVIFFCSCLVFFRFIFLLLYRLFLLSFSFVFIINSTY